MNWKAIINNQVSWVKIWVSFNEKKFSKRLGALQVKEAKDDVLDQQDQLEEQKEQAGGGIGLGGGLLTQEGIQNRG